MDIGYDLVIGLGLGLMIMIMMMIDDEDRHGVIVKMMNGMMVREIMKMLTSIEGWGVVPRMAPLPSQGGSMLRGER